mgnify:CR=1 FL=1
MSDTNIIQLAVMAAGGNEAVAAKFGISVFAVRAWGWRHSMPAKHITALCELAKPAAVIKPEAILGYMYSQKQAKARAAAESA